MQARRRLRISGFLAAGVLSEDVRKGYEELYQGLNPVDLLQQIEAAQEKLFQLPRLDS